ncbi:hypothetical protein Tco_1291854 [Tanacetum coccineum]
MLLCCFAFAYAALRFVALCFLLFALCCLLLLLVCLACCFVLCSAAVGFAFALLLLYVANCLCAALLSFFALLLPIAVFGSLLVWLVAPSAACFALCCACLLCLQLCSKLFLLALLLLLLRLLACAVAAGCSCLLCYVFAVANFLLSFASLPLLPAFCFGCLYRCCCLLPLLLQLCAIHSHSIHSFIHFQISNSPFFNQSIQFFHTIFTYHHFSPDGCLLAFALLACCLAPHLLG